MNLDDIKDRARKCEEARDGDMYAWAAAAIASAADVPLLVQEIERLTNACNAVQEGNRILDQVNDKYRTEMEGMRATLNLRDGQLTTARRLADERAAALLEEQTVHAKTMDNFEASAESWLEERTRLLDRYARLDAEHARLRTMHDELKEHCTAVTEARDEARAELRASDTMALREWGAC